MDEQIEPFEMDCQSKCKWEDILTEGLYYR